MSGGDCYWKLSHDGELYFEIPNECIVALDCSIGDEIVWSKNNDGSYSLSKDTKKLESNSVIGFLVMHMLCKVLRCNALF